jgi:3-hydroxybutyryl-CoA dehydrogenase
MAEVLEDYALSQRARKKGSMKKVGIIGCGTMGQEIAQVVSRNGIEVIFVDVSDERVTEVFLELNAHLDEIIDKWGLTYSEKRAILSRIHGTTEYHDISDCDLIIESINSRKPGTSIELRKDIFRKVEAVVPQDTVITSNTSTLIISELASVLDYPDRAVGLHFLSPASRVKIVEVVKGLYTSEHAFEFVIKFARMLDKKVISLIETPGNISTRLIVTLINEACEILMEGVASASSVDETMRLGFGMQFGPLYMADSIGLDKVIRWMDNLYQEFGDTKFKPNPIIKRLARTGNIGKKTGAGFYKYDKGKIVEESIHCPEFK